MILLFTGFVILALFGLGVKVYQKKAYIWLPGHIKDSVFGARHPVVRGKVRHIMFLFVDHFEAPLGEKMIGERRINEWVEKYSQIIHGHKDADGRYPQHTWFYAAEKFEMDYDGAERELGAISKLCSEGYGEIEFHIHHHNDTSASLREKIERGKEIFNKFGALITDEKSPKQVFGFIHGSWTLDNTPSTGTGERCGVNNELWVLKEAGCYADFTFPAYTHLSQPRRSNSIYYALDDPDRPKSYDTGRDVGVGREPWGDLMLIQGPLMIDWKDWRHLFYPRVEYGDITDQDPPTSHRVDQWVKCNIHVKGRPEWVFVKIYCHGCYDSTMEVVLGPQIDEMLTYLEDKYNDGINCRLHYVTAREAYNIIKAAEDGKGGGPGQYRDYLIKPYKNRNKVIKK